MSNKNKYMFILGISLILLFAVSIGNFDLSKVATDSGFDSGGSSSSSSSSSSGNSSSNAGPLTKNDAIVLTLVFTLIVSGIVLTNVDKKLLKEALRSKFVKILVIFIAVIIALYVGSLLFPNVKGILNQLSSVMILILVLLIFIFIPLIIKKMNKVLDNDYENKQSMMYLPKTEENLKLLEECYDIFVEVQKAWMNFDYNKLRETTTDELYNMYYNQLSSLKLKGQKNVMSDFELINYNLYSVDKNNGLVTVKVRLEVEFYDYIIDKDDKIIRGNKNKKNHMIYELNYVYSENLVKECPNCSATLNIGDTVCNYCNTKITSVGSKMKLSTKKCIRQG